ncbi:hypothetical protein [Sansalvadorimonas verongulae]|uniref:hypothetical protein n=1 Tax=Sansalvadorimonas verongulae TaxID=2172824 RepID=UPI0012BCABB6|nr:hypothetical protein [Sansalvadorimonas verongulae]
MKAEFANIAAARRCKPTPYSLLKPLIQGLFFDIQNLSLVKHSVQQQAHKAINRQVSSI